MKPSLCLEDLRQQNSEYKNTGGISQENCSHGFQPAFHDAESNRTEIARHADGTPAPMHLLDGVPNDWVTKRDNAGHIIAVKSTIVAGFIRDGVFYTREQASLLCSQREQRTEEFSDFHALPAV